MSALSAPLRIGSVTMRNRIIMPAMANNTADPEGHVNDLLVKHYQRHAAGGSGMIIVEHSYVEPAGRMAAHQLGIWRDEQVEGLARIAQAVRSGGALAVIQITHGGTRSPSAATGQQPAGPSALRVPGDRDEPRELAAEEIAALPGLFAAAARRARAAGFDGVQIHGAHGSLLNQFLSPATNHRTDGYGGGLNGRLRLVEEVLDAVREALAGGLLAYRFPTDDCVADGITPAMAGEMAPRLVKRGIQLLDCSGGMCGSYPPGRSGQGYFAKAAGTVKEALAAAGSDVPVSVTGGITEPAFANRLVRNGTVDAVCVGRAQVTDPDWARKAIASLG